MARSFSRFLVCAIGAGLLFGSAATASADGGVTYVRSSAPAAFTWNGFYVGANAGWAWGNSDYTHTPTGAWDSDKSVPVLASQGSGSFSPSGFLGGGQFGYNWQGGNLVLGAEADFQGWNMSASRSANNPNPVVPGTTLTFSESFDSNWLATLRLRAGIAFGQTLIYATGGLAVADIRFNQSVFFSASKTTASGAVHKQEAGFAVGGGVEQAFGRWSLKVEYLFVDFDTANAQLINSDPGFAGFTHNAANDLSSHIVRAGLNYRW